MGKAEELNHAVIAAGCVSTVDGDGLAADEGRVGRHQKRRHGSDFVRPAQPLQGVLLGDQVQRRSIPGIPKTLSVIGVSTKPGQMAFARMPLGP